ncbi:STAS/SEC14 domain-containing protein [Halospeciosus flavus]|uniref:STAS/SEC14 domain-containing protein n=2 Tax=Halospeciosus flavus TaxID=3032283 RepID=A0ABD5Z3B3_9EURY|nr:STAS/SEC14 domain-containing protein [Halospeciosus flavus]
MYEKLDRSEGRVVGYEVRDELTEEELEEILLDLEEVIIEEGSVRILVHVPSFPSPDLDALDEDIGFWLEHGDDIDRYAIVGDSKLVEWVTELEDRLTDIDLQYFEEEDLDEAWAWLEDS